MYICYICGARFEEPDIMRYREDMNGEGAWQDYVVQVCPVCMSEEIDMEDESDV